MHTNDVEILLTDHGDERMRSSQVTTLRIEREARRLEDVEHKHA